jgi:diguanylate cyclase (GGDEF)-like protein
MGLAKLPEKALGIVRQHAYGLIIALLWTATALAMFALRDVLGAVLLVWLPSAIASAALFCAQPRQRAGVLVGLAAANIAVALSYNLGFVASLGYAVANVSEAVIVVLIAKRVVGRRPLPTLRLREMAGLMIAAMAGSTVGALISFPFRPQQELVQFGWWFLATMLGTAVCAPILLFVHAWWQHRKAGLPIKFAGGATAFAIAMAALFVLDWWVLSFSAFSLGPVVIAGLVFAVARFGQLGASTGVLVYGLAGTLHSIGGAPPAAYLTFDPFSSGLILQAYMLLMLATSLPLAALLMANDRLSLRLKTRNSKLNESVQMLAMAEEVARIGRWRFYPKSGEQDWSSQMFRINGLDPKLGRDPGDIRGLLPDGGKDLFGELKNHSEDRATYSFEYHVRTPKGEDRRLKMHARNEFDAKGKLNSMFGVVMDVTEAHQRQDLLDKERDKAMRLAAHAQVLAMTDPLTGLANRRRTIEQLEKCIVRCDRGGGTMALIAFDVDHFKQVNDRFGHQVGDEVLIRIAELARDQVRASDLIGRTGGEEFVWLMPDAGAVEASNAAERLRLAIEKGSGKGGLPSVTVSIGYALWRPGDDSGALLGKADTALYVAKEGGRNMVQRAA